MLVKYGVYQAYCPADNEYMDIIGFYVESAGYPHMPVGPMGDYAKVVGNIYKNPDWLENKTETLKIGRNYTNGI